MPHRSLAIVPTAALLCSVAACAVASSDSGPTTASESEIVGVPQTDVERQAIGNTWIYAHASWVESLQRNATGAPIDVSESYWTYWHWFDQIANGVAPRISVGGNWQTANSIVRKYGVASERDFLPDGGDAKERQSAALAVVNESLNRGALKNGRRDRAVVRRELDRAWGLTSEAVAMLDRTFGADAARSFTSSEAVDSASPIQRAADVKVAYSTAPGRAPAPKALSLAAIEWRQVFYAPSDHRAFQARVQRALHDRQPVIATWFVDFNALENRANGRRGAFSLATLTELGPGRQGGSTTLLQGYQAHLADGRVLAAGATLDPTKAEDRALLDGVLLPTASIDFFRVKNSWGSERPDRAFAPGMPEYHDLYLDYLDGPVKKCVERDGNTDPSNCPTTTTPLESVVLPPGY